MGRKAKATHSVRPEIAKKLKPGLMARVLPMQEGLQESGIKLKKARGKKK